MASPTSRLRINNQGFNFLVDTGATISVIPATDRSAPQGPPVYAVNGTSIKTYGSRRLTLSLGLRRVFPWEFVLADVTDPIIGCDFLSHYNIMVDVRNTRLVDNTTGITSIAPIAAPGSQISVVTTPSTSDPLLHELTQKYPRVINPTNKMPLHTSCSHAIITQGHQVSCRPRRLTGEKLTAAREHFQELMARGIVQPSKSSWSSPIHLVQKTTGEWRIVGDYRRLNEITVPDRYPVPYLSDFQAILHGTTIYSKLDLQSAFQQVPMDESSIPKTAVATPFGLFEYNFMPYGLCGAAQTQQRLMDEIFRDLPFVFVYIDDILVASSTSEEHREHLKTVFRKLDEYNLAVNITKCEFGQSSIEYLGHTISPEGISPQMEKVKTITQFPRPTTIAALKRFLGLANFYRRFLKSAATFLYALNRAAITKKKNDQTPVDWTEDLDAAFQQAKEEIAKVTLLAHPSSVAELALYVDASDKCIGAALHQRTEEGERPLGFFSKTLSDTKQRYSTYDRELEAIFQGIRHFKDDIEGRDLIVHTDHKPLIYALAKAEKTTNQRQARQLDFISQYTRSIQHIPGEENAVADALSRIEAISPPTPAIDASQLARAQLDDQEIIDILQGRTTTSLQLQRTTDPFGTTLTCDTSSGRHRPFVPAALRQTIIRQLHNQSHPGTSATRRLVAENFVWPNMNKDSKEFVKNCLPCQRSKITRHTHAPLQKPKPPTGRFRHLNVDIIGPYPVSQGNRFCLTIIDRFTRWPAAIPMPDATAPSIAKALFEGWIQHFGVPERIVTDRGRQFESTLFRELNNAMGTKHLETTAYRPQANGIIERWHRTLKNAIKCITETDWAPAIPLIVLGLRNTVKEDLQATPADLVFGEKLQLPGGFFQKTDEQPTSDFVKQLQQQFQQIRVTTTQHHRNAPEFIPKDLTKCEWIFLRQDAVRRPFQQPYVGPFQVLRRNEKTITIQRRDKEETVGIDRTKPAFLESDNQNNAETADRVNNNKNKYSEDRGVEFRFPPTIQHVQPAEQPRVRLAEQPQVQEPRRRSRIPVPAPTITRAGRQTKIPQRYT